MREGSPSEASPLLVIHMITFAITMSILILMYVAYTIPAEGEDLDEQVVTILSSLSIAVITISAFLRSWILKRSVAASKKERRSPMVGELFTAQVITLVIREFGVILCFVCTLQTGEFEYVLYAGLAAVFLNLVTWPREIPMK